MAGTYMEHGEMRRIALEMALDRFQSRSDGDENILELAESFFQFLIGNSS